MADAALIGSRAPFQHLAARLEMLAQSQRADLVGTDRSYLAEGLRTLVVIAAGAGL
jgi:hypothetical protein